jgi:apolipoprotein N-acyltransferase
VKFFFKSHPLTPELKAQRKKDRCLLILSGILMGISFPPVPFPFTLLMFAGLVPLLKVLETKSTLLEINKSMYLAAFVFSLIATYWVGSWQSEADTFLMISGALLMFVNPAQLLIASTLYYFAKKIFKRNVALFTFPLFWITYEYVAMITEIRFPWLTLGNGLSFFNSFIQAADIVGAMGLSLLVVYINVFLYRAFLFYKDSAIKYYINISIAVIIFLIVLIYGIIRFTSYEIPDKKVTVGLIQPDINPWDKWATGDLNTFLNLYLNLSQQAINEGAEILIWPETALPVYLMSGPYQNVVDSLYSFLTKNNIFLITGMPDLRYHNGNIPDDAKYSERGNYYYTTHNAVFLISPHSRELQKFGKIKLVPFGERVPYVDQLPFLGNFIKWGVGLTGWNVGRDSTVFKLPFPQNSDGFITYPERDSLFINGLVCYESIFPDFVAGFVDKGAQIIAVVTNDSWYGKLSGPYQHKEYGVLRAVENRRSVVRAANGGISCIINPLGITEIESKMFERTVVVGDVSIETEKTFYTQNPLIVPVLSSTFSLWILGLFILKKMKDRFKL